MDNGFLAGISYVDIVIALGFLIFITAGVIRGFTNDVLGLMTWVGAFALTALLFPLLQPTIQNYITEPFFADVVLGFVTFILTLILLVAIAKSISNRVRKSMLSGLDRTLGILSGLFRGTLILTAIYFMSLMFWKAGATPDAFQNSRLLPIINTSGQFVHRFLIPKDIFPNRLVQHMYGDKSVTRKDPPADDLVDSLSAPKAGLQNSKTSSKKKKKSLEKGYKNLERKALENLIDTMAPKEN